MILSTHTLYPRPADLTQLERTAICSRRPRLRALASVLLDLGFNW